MTSGSEAFGLELNRGDESEARHHDLQLPVTIIVSFATAGLRHHG
jgi:hypothetical protein